MNTKNFGAALRARMEAASFEQIGTGGNCEAWSKTLADRSYILICTDDQSCFGDADNREWLVGRYHEGEVLVDCPDLCTLEDAITKAEQFVQTARFPLGSRVVLTEDVERFPMFIARKGKTGTVVTNTGDLVAVRMDETLPHCEEWNNEVQFYLPNDDALSIALIEGGAS